jgi:hypothetical protein
LVLGSPRRSGTGLLTPIFSVFLQNHISFPRKFKIEIKPESNEKKRKGKSKLNLPTPPVLISAIATLIVVILLPGHHLRILATVSDRQTQTQTQCSIKTMESVSGVANLRPTGSGPVVPIVWSRFFVFLVVVAECDVDQALDETLHFVIEREKSMKKSE